MGGNNDNYQKIKIVFSQNDQNVVKNGNVIPKPEVLGHTVHNSLSLMEVEKNMRRS